MFRQVPSRLLLSSFNDVTPACYSTVQVAANVELGLGVQMVLGQRLLVAQHPTFAYPILQLVGGALVAAGGEGPREAAG